ncbi:MAG: SsrA-binding protein [Patescibacteria group bacterium]|nr:MAG: SsrA-binding protein [Patescibacteria group bacterium]
MKILNKKASFNYTLLDRFEAGISLTGEEIKTLKERGADLGNSYVKIINNEAFLINANIFSEGEDPTRSRKLLLHKREIISLESKIKAKKLTLIPVKMYNKGRRIKIELALAKPKKEFEKKETLKRQDIKREIEKELKSISTT